MSIMFDENIVAIWFIDLEPSEDYLMALSRRPEGGLHFVYRVRHYNPESKDPFDEKDAKSWQSFATNDPNEAKAIDAARAMAKGLLLISATIHGVKKPHMIWEFIRKPGTSPEAFMDEFMKAPFVHVQRKTLQ